MDPYGALLDQVRQAQKAAEMSQQELAQRMGVKQAAISQILSGRKRMGRKSLGGVLRVFPHLRPYVLAVLTATGKQESSA